MPVWYLAAAAAGAAAILAVCLALRSRGAAFGDRLNDISDAAIEAPDLESMTQAMADRLAAIGRADSCFITFWDGERGITVPSAAYGPHRDTYRSFRPEPGERTLTGALAETGCTTVIPDTRASDHVSPRIAELFRSRSMLGLPMRADDRVLGAIILSYDRPCAFPEAMVKRCELAARRVSFAVAKMRLLEDERRRSDELRVLNRIGLEISSGRDLDSVIRTAFEQCRGILDLDTFYLGLYEPTSSTLRFALFYDDGHPVKREPQDLRATPGLSGYVIRTGRSLHLPDTTLPGVEEEYGIVRLGGQPSRSYIGVPLRHADRVLGVLSVQSRKPHAYTAWHVQLLETVGAQATVAIENARLYGELRLLSTTDGLTGLLNYRSVSELGPAEFSRARRTGRPLSLVFFDIDHFKDFNTLYGHETGNAVLRAMADRVRGMVRSMDSFARYGGEEFIVVLPETSVEEAVAIAERVRAGIEAMEVAEPGGGRILRVTVSLGVSSARPDIGSFQDLVEEANAAERAAKENGRNRVETAAEIGKVVP